MKKLEIYNAASAPQTAREQEALVFRLAARRLRDATDSRSRNAAIGINHEIWSHMFRDLSSPENRLPAILKQDCLTLARFSMDYSTRALLQDLSIEPLIDVNERVAEGLGASPVASMAAAPSGWTPALA